MTQLDSMLLWARHLVARLAGALALITGIERAALAIAGLNLGLQIAMLASYRDATHWFSMAGFLAVTILLGVVIMDAALTRVHGKRLGAAMIKINVAKPTGAPRVAEVACRHGDPHRFVYGPTGWEAAGPAVEHRPIPEEVPTS